MACPSCKASDFDDSKDTLYGTTEDGLFLVQRNACGRDLLEVGMVNYATFFFFIGTLFLLNYYLNAREIRADEDRCVSVLPSFSAFFTLAYLFA